MTLWGDGRCNVERGTSGVGIPEWHGYDSELSG